MLDIFSDLLSIELNEYGLQIDAPSIYIALDYRIIGAVLITLIARKIYKKVRAN